MGDGLHQEHLRGCFCLGRSGHPHALWTHPSILSHCLLWCLKEGACGEGPVQVGQLRGSQDSKDLASSLGLPSPQGKGAASEGTDWSIRQTPGCGGCSTRLADVLAGSPGSGAARLWMSPHCTKLGPHGWTLVYTAAVSWGHADSPRAGPCLPRSAEPGRRSSLPPRSSSCRPRPRRTR